jgi:hypothetical protein
MNKGVPVYDMNGPAFDAVQENAEFARMGQKYGPALGRAASGIAASLYKGDILAIKSGLSSLKDVIREIESGLK